MKEFDNSYLSDTVRVIAGVDEAGRGPLAGPVVAAAVIFENDFEIPGINDSKQLSEAAREELYPLIIAGARSWAYTIISHTEIDRINILQASLLAMKKSVEKLTIKPDLVLVDGNKSYSKDSNIVTVVKGDAKSFAIAAASIIAKVERDRLMVEYSKEYPHYKWEKNKGYGTKEHIAALKQYGKSPLHRRTFLKNIFEEEEIQLDLSLE